ncbi:MAG: hypothetical protein R6X09_08805 [Bacteroidales bacterium]
MEQENKCSVIRVEHLIKSFNSEPVLQGISFTLAPGENLMFNPTLSSCAWVLVVLVKLLPLWPLCYKEHCKCVLT